MAIKTFTSGEVLTAADTNTYLANGGLQVCVPSSVTNGSVVSGTGSATANSTVSSVVLKGVFSSTYDSYRVVISNLTMSSTAAGTVIYARLHDGTNPAATNYQYGAAKIDIAAGTVAGTSVASGTNGVIVGYGTGDKFGTVFDIVNPNVASHTLFPNLTGANVSTGYMYSGAGMHQTSTGYTALELSPSTGTITGGVITVYGYRK